MRVHWSRSNAQVNGDHKNLAWKIISAGRQKLLRSVGFGMDVAFHLTCPFEKAPEIAAFPPHEFPKLQEADLRHLYSTIGLDAPQEVRTSPRRQPVAFGRVPKKTDRVAHDDVTATPS